MLSSHKNAANVQELNLNPAFENAQLVFQVLKNIGMVKLRLSMENSLSED